MSGWNGGFFVDEQELNLMNRFFRVKLEGQRNSRCGAALLSLEAKHNQALITMAIPSRITRHTSTAPGPTRMILTGTYQD